MAYLVYANPLDGYIRPDGSPPVYNSFRVTAPFGSIDPFHPTPHTGMDVGDGAADADNVYACAAGKVTMARLIDGCVGILHSDGTTSYYCHLVLPHIVAVGATITRRQLVGHIGSTGTTAAHLHLERKIGTVHTDPWPWLEQNQPEDAVTTITQDAIPSTFWQAKGGALTGYKVGAAPLTRTYAAGSQASTNAIASKVDPPPAGWPAPPLLYVSTGGLAGYYIAQAAVTFTAPDPNAALKQELAATKAELAVANTRIAGAKNALGA